MFLNRDLDVKCLKDGWWELVELNGPVGDVFDDKAAGNANIRTSIVRVIREPVPLAQRQNPQRQASVAPSSSARPRKRPPENVPNNVSSNVNWQASRSAEDVDRAAKRQRLNEITSDDFQDRDHPLMSCEASVPVPGNAFSQTSRHYSPVHLVEDSQRSPLSKCKSCYFKSISRLMVLVNSNAYATPTSLSLPSPNMPPNSSQPEEIPDSPCGTSAAHVDLDANDTKSECSTTRPIHDAPTAERHGSPELAAVAGAEDSETSKTDPRQLLDRHRNNIAPDKLGSGRQVRHGLMKSPNVNRHNTEPDIIPKVMESRFALGDTFGSSDTAHKTQPPYTGEGVKVSNPWSKSDGRLTRPTITPKQPKRPTLIDTEQQKKLSSIWDPIDSDTEKSLGFEARRRPNAKFSSSQLPLTLGNLASSQKRNGLPQGFEIRASVTNGSSTSSRERRRHLPGLGTSAPASYNGTFASNPSASSYQVDVPLSSQDSELGLGGEPKSAASLFSSVHQPMYTPNSSQGVTMSRTPNPRKPIQSQDRVDLTRVEVNESQFTHHEQETFDIERAEEEALLDESFRTEALPLQGSSQGYGELSEKRFLPNDVVIPINETKRSDQAREEQHLSLEEGTRGETTHQGLDYTEEVAQIQAGVTSIAPDAEDEAHLLRQEIQIRKQNIGEDKAKADTAKEEQRLKVEKSQIVQKAKEEEEARKIALAKEQAKDKEAKAKETKTKETKAKETKAKEAKAKQTKVREGKVKEAKLQEERKVKAEEKARQQRKAKDQERAKMAEIAKQEAKVKAQKAMDERKKAKAQEHAERQAQMLAASIATPQRKETIAGDPTTKRKYTSTQGGSVKAKKSNPRTPQMSSDPVEEPDRKRKSLTPAFPDSSGSKPPSSARIGAASSEHTPQLKLQPNGQSNLTSALRQSPSILRRSVSFANDPTKTPEALAQSHSASRGSMSNTPSRALGSSPVGSINIGDRLASDNGSLRKPSLPANGEGSKATKTYSTKKPSAKSKVQTKITEIVKRDVKLKGKMPEPAMIASDEIIISSDSEKSVSSYYSESEGEADARNAKPGPSSRKKRSKRDTHSNEEIGFSDDGIPILQTQAKPPPKASTQPIISIPLKFTSHTDSKGETGVTSSSRSSRSPARYDIDKSATPEWVTSESGSQIDQDSEDGLEIVGRPSRSPPISGSSTPKPVPSSTPAKIDKTDAKPQGKPSNSRAAHRTTPPEVSKLPSLNAKRSRPSTQTHGKKVEDEVTQQLQREIRLSGEGHKDKKPSPKAIINGGPSETPLIKKPLSNAKPKSSQKPDPRAGGIQHFPSLTDIRSQPEIYKGWEPPPEDRRPDFMKMKRNGVPEASKAANGSEDSSSESEDESSSDDDSEDNDARKSMQGGKSLGRLMKRRCSLQ